jgi:ssDNA-binding Zn-finger/Zn-ribbon topoisomerase 1
MSRLMAQVTCPQCQTRQEIEPDAEGYRCIVCAGTWSFVRCTVCSQRFHTRPGTRAWTCPNCGTPHGRNRRGISRVGIPLPLLVGGLVILGLVVFLLVRSLGSHDGGRITPSSPTSASPIADPANQVCGDLGAVQVLRVDALGDAADALTADADALRAAGETERAGLVDDLVAAVRTYQEVAEGGGDTQAATDQLLDALGAVDWCD